MLLFSKFRVRCLRSDKVQRLLQKRGCIRMIPSLSDENVKQKKKPPGYNYQKICLLGAFVGALITTKQDRNEDEAGEFIEGLPIYTARDVMARDGSDLQDKTSESSKVWVSFKEGVYDVTDFINEHPGGEKLLIGAGGPIEPFWSLYAVHKKPYVFKLLETYRVGNLDKTDIVVENSDDPYSDDPQRHPVFNINNTNPFNAEPPLNILADNFITPNELFYVRNHHPVPNIDPEDYELQIEGIGLPDTVTLTLEDLMTKFPQTTITAAIQCAGNRRADMAQHKPVRGMDWGGAAISNATWTGPKLCQVLEYLGWKEEDHPSVKHVWVDGVDYGPDGSPYGASILIEKAVDPRQDVILALKMNGEVLPRDHGYPVRLVAPGVVGARNVKWVGNITLSEEESHSHWQRRDYKGFNPSIDWHNVNFDDKYAVSIQNQPITSMVCDPLNGGSVSIVDNRIHLKGYAYSGAGAKVIRVDVTLDEGVTWQTAELVQDDSPLNRAWSWSLWECDAMLPKGLEAGSQVKVTCCAVDANYNRQPEKVKNIWNLRGCLSNSWHSISVKLV